jgi:polysaccharide pyruvyl transferase WcaK-like protein
MSRSRGNRPYNLALFGVFGSGNFGNDATLDACMAALCPPLPRSRILCVAANPTVIAEAYGVEAVGLTRRNRYGRVMSELSSLYHAWRSLRRARRLIIAGTGVLDDQHVRPTQLPLEVLRWSLAARLAGAELVFLSVGAGPIDQVWSRRFLKTAVALAHEVSYRDSRSKDFMASIGRDVGSDRVLPDLALALEPPVGAQRPSATQRAVAIGVLSRLNWRESPDGYRRYEDSIVELAERIAAGGELVRIVTGDEADVDTRDAIMQRLASMEPSVEGDECHSFSDVVRIVSTCDVLVASRYHNLVAAVIAGIPIVSLAYGPKNDALLEQFEMPSWGHDIDSFSVEVVMSNVREASRRPPVSRDTLEGYRQSIRDEFDHLIDE